MSEILSEGKSIEAVISESGSYASITKGGSMLPLFKTARDVIIVTPHSHPLKKYDIPLYKQGDKYVLHRIIAVDEQKKIYVIRGDNTFVKEYVPFDSVVGVLTSFNRKGKSISVSNKGYRLYSRFWVAVYPFRFLAHKLKMLLRRIIKGKKSDSNIG